MTDRTPYRNAAVFVAALVVLSLGSRVLRGDEPGRFGRLFRLGGSTTPAAPPVVAAPAPPVDATPSATALVAPPVESTLPPPSGVTPRIIAQPRNYRGVTDSDPVVTRISLARSSEGASFGMFLQVFADGTVIDSEGVHQVGREGIKALLAVLNSGELYRLKGHCGAPPTDFIEDVHVVVFKRSLRGLKANSFSFSGNPQGCDPAVRRLQGVLDALQTSYSRSVAPTAPTSEASATPHVKELRLNDGISQP